MGAGGLLFDEDDILDNNDDEDLRKDPVSQIDLRVSGLLKCWPPRVLTSWTACRLM